AVTPNQKETPAMSKLARFVLILLPLLCSGCVRSIDLTRLADQQLFRFTGSTPLTGIEPLTMKEIHLDNGNLLGREVIVRGAVVGSSRHGTYLVLSDETARLLVVLTDLDPMMPQLGNSKPEVISIL